MLSIKLNISNTVAPIDFEKDNVDLAVQFGAGKWPAGSASAGPNPGKLQAGPFCL